MNTYSFKNLLSLASLFLLSVFIWGIFSAPTHANTMEVSTGDSSRYYELKAKIAYLEAFIEALRDGDLSPRPTFVTVLSKNEVAMFGTLARDPKSGLIEVCGPTSKGTVDWGDGVTGNIMGLGCSGDVSTFVMSHTYEESGNYKIRIEDSLGRDSTHSVAVRVQ